MTRLCAKLGSLHAKIVYVNILTWYSVVDIRLAAVVLRYTALNWGCILIKDSMLEGWSSTAIAGVADAFIVDENNCIGPGRVVLIGLGNEDTCKALQNSNILLLWCTMMYSKRNYCSIPWMHQPVTQNLIRNTECQANTFFCNLKRK